jgi:hypothetical protein
VTPKRRRCRAAGCVATTTLHSATGRVRCPLHGGVGEERAAQRPQPAVTAEIDAGLAAIFARRVTAPRQERARQRREATLDCVATGPCPPRVSEAVTVCARPQMERSFDSVSSNTSRKAG